MEIDGVEVRARRCPTCVGAVIFLSKTTCSDCGHELLEVEEGKPVVWTTEEREALIEVLVYHRPRENSSCHCGWAELGRSWPVHIADVYEMVLKEKEL